MRVTEGVPEHDVRVFDRTVCLGPADEAIAAGTLIRKIARQVRPETIRSWDD